MKHGGQYERSVAPIQMISVIGGMIARAECACCGSRAEWRITNNRPAPSIVQLHFAQMGWLVRKRLTCGDCLAVAKALNSKIRPVKPAPQKEIQVTDPKLLSTAEMIIAKPDPGAAGQAMLAAANRILAKHEPTDAAKAQRRMVYMALEDGYDEAAKRYKPGHTDAAVAKTVGCAEALVAKVREEFFGANGPPDEIVTLRTEMADFNVELGEAFEAYDKLRTRADFLEERLAEIYKRNGWTV